MTDSLLKTALADTASELALVKAEIAGLRKLNASLENAIAARDVKITTITAEREKASHRASTYALLLSRAGFDQEAIDRQGLWALPAMDHIRCSLELVDFVGPSRPGNLEAIHALTARDLVSASS